MPGAPDARGKLFRLMTGHIPSQCVYVAAKLRLVDTIPEGGTAVVDDLAAGAGVNTDALYRVMRLLTAEGLFEEVSPRTFATTEMGELLRDGETSLRYFSMLQGGETLPMFGHMLDTIRTGETVPVLEYGKTRFELLADDPEKSEIFNRAMRARAGPYVAAVSTVDWSGVETVVDVGGGIGGILLPLLRAEEHLRGILYDLPHVAEDATRAIADAGLAERCTFVAGSFFEAVPPGEDVYLLSNILHDWDDVESTRILATCRAASRPQSRLVVAENLVARTEGPDSVKTMDLLMLVIVGGRERTETEFRELLRSGGFELERVGGSGPFALEARPV